MSTLSKSLVVAVGTGAILLLTSVLTGLGAVDVVTTGSGGLGAFSAGFSELFLLAIPVGIGAALLSWLVNRRPVAKT